MDSSLSYLDKALQAELLEVCQTGTWQEVKRVVRQGASLYRPDEDWRNALHHACICNNYDVVRGILRQKELRFMIYLRTKEGYSPCTLACICDHGKLVGLFIRYGVFYSVGCTAAGWVAFHIACLLGSHSVVKELLRLTAVDVNVQDKRRDTPLHLAITKGHVDVVKTLLKNEADVNRGNIYFVTPLHQAVMTRSLQMVALVLLKKPDTEARDVSGNTPLNIACFLRCDQIVKSLLAKRANVHIANNSGFTPLHTTCKNEDVGIVRMLLKAGVNVNVNINRKTPLYVACSFGNRGVVRLLLNNGARVHVAKGLDPIRAAEEGKHMQIKEMLTKHLIHSLSARGFGKAARGFGKAV